MTKLFDRPNYNKTHKKQHADYHYQWRRKQWKQRLLSTTKQRAKQRGWEFKLLLEDIPEMPELCPVLNIPIFFSTERRCGPKDNSPSLDRINSNEGYIKGNVRIISNRANTLKNNATLEELEAIVEDFKRLTINTNAKETN